MGSTRGTYPIDSRFQDHETARVRPHPQQFAAAGRLPDQAIGAYRTDDRGPPVAGAVQPGGRMGREGPLPLLVRTVAATPPLQTRLDERMTREQSNHGCER